MRPRRSALAGRGAINGGYREESRFPFPSGKSGATAIEYGLIATGIAVVIPTAVGTVGTSLSGVFTSVAASL
jgi:pilus assembly protein Flp/PilA